MMTEFSESSDGVEIFPVDLASFSEAVAEYRLLIDDPESGNTSATSLYEELLMAEVVDAAGREIAAGDISFDEAIRVMQDLGMSYRGDPEQDYSDLLEQFTFGKTIVLRRIQNIGVQETGRLKAVHLVPYSPGSGKNIVPALVVTIETDKGEPDIEELVEFSLRKGPRQARRYVHPRLIQ